MAFGKETNHQLGHNIQCSDQKQIINLVVTYSVLTSNNHKLRRNIQRFDQ